ncbi:bifunctional 2-keto-4-hydroxyglutarate aldolase/2-keto-3-deoxy-6-phosphogluconate aldolase [Cytobacillus gottheilii]|uniref:Bifunctional 2-keto-4-hydroxyglutarate aldolase/2-keto-3-deoxy-6-phosphogluconate aldolase n=1 Tax=Cytobacillus gottheilii TaxID=859144 RepID=A0ABX8FCX4_9BACI|nr:bifunctional 2-keto-4-hydroxyglutarate aldolase/2-keto-3-deoxy-6-phosphogluconate aldolase [Cytobacillus gottheilii]QVY61748.1 bifunctional 2-keto-4-hydroxyglutarate aldolase/2-keto-3-deoxy-6-phosphogluconate aldolase [Cytobacillus gottheilii]
MKKINTLQQIAQSKIVAVIRADSSEEAIQITKACIEGGITCVELTYTIPGVEDAIKSLVSEYKDDSRVVVGAGTVLDETTARLAIMAGSEFVVSPAFSKQVAKLCNLYGIPYMPGCVTITEMQEALTYGTDVIKLFPGSLVGPDYIKAVKAPLPHVNIMPTGGVSLDNIKEWLDNGCVAVGVGGNLVNAAKADGDYQKVTELARQYVEKIN